MTKASNNPFPSILVVEGGTPTSPSSGDQRLFIDSADHKLKRVNSGGTVTTIEGGGGGGGVATYNNAIASAPGSPGSGDIWFPSDAPYTARYNGSAWDYRYKGMPATLPPTISTWVNQKSAGLAASYDTSSGGLWFYQPVDTADSWSFLLKSTPGTPYTVTAYIETHIYAVNYSSAGIVLRDSSGSAFVGFYQTFNSAVSNQGHRLQIGHGTALAVTVADYDKPIMKLYQWFKINDDGSTRTYYVGDNGVNWETVYSQAHTTPMTPNQIGLGLDSRNASSLPAALFVASWKEA